MPNIYGRQEPQYQVAIWATTDDQAATCETVAAEVGKSVPVLPMAETLWQEGEASHQKFFGGL